MRSHFIDGEPFVPSSPAAIDVIDPSDGLVFEQLVRGDASDVDRAVRAARRAFDGPWSRLGAAERGRRLTRLSGRLADHLDELALIEARDCGKPLKQARADAAAIVRYFEFYGGASDKLHGDDDPLPRRLRPC